DRRARSRPDSPSETRVANARKQVSCATERGAEIDRMRFLVLLVPLLLGACNREQTAQAQTPLPDAGRFTIKPAPPIMFDAAKSSTLPPILFDAGTRSPLNTPIPPPGGTPTPPR